MADIRSRRNPLTGRADNYIHYQELYVHYFDLIPPRAEPMPSDRPEAGAAPDKLKGQR
tara:strand:+ start:143 stop:316 length:174 start_codon:yes stop_codon:yes gene_type:complete